MRRAEANDVCHRALPFARGPVCSGVINAAGVPIAGRGRAAVQTTRFRASRGSFKKSTYLRAAYVNVSHWLAASAGTFVADIRGERESCPGASACSGGLLRPRQTNLAERHPARFRHSPSMLTKATAQGGPCLFRSREQTQPLHRTERGTHHAPPNLRITAQGLNHEQ